LPSTLASLRHVDIRTPAPAVDGPPLVAGYTGAAIEVTDVERARSLAERNIEARLNTDPGGYYLWIAGTPVSLAGCTGPTPNGIRIGPVYTPPEHRNHGYASAAVAALSQLLLERGFRSCFLFTDLSNPTSNKIYQAVGYQPVCDVDEYAFGAEPAS